MIGGLGKSPRSKNVLVIKADSSSFCEFHYSKILSVICITIVKKFVHCLGGGHGALWLPLDPPLCVIVTVVSSVNSKLCVLREPHIWGVNLMHFSFCVVWVIFWVGVFGFRR